MTSIIPNESLPMHEWWRRYTVGALECGYGGARAPEEPRPIQLPADIQPTSRITDYREAMGNVIWQDHNRPPLHMGRPKSDEKTMGLREGTALEAFSEGSVYILDVLTALLNTLKAFYPLYRARAFAITQPAVQLPLVERIVKLRLMLVALRADTHIPARIDAFIANTLVYHLPSSPRTP